MTQPEAKQLLDSHVHLAALDDGSNGCHIAPQLTKSVVGLILRKTLGIDLNRPPQEVNQFYLDKLLRQLRESRYVSRAIILAFDAVHDSSGERRLDKSSLVVSNDYTLAVCGANKELLPAASVHPFRKDALDELVRVKEAGALLIKLLPVSQVFDPNDKALRPYWQKCAELQLPLLVHTGLEFTLSGHVQSYGDPAGLEAPLAEGATVIAAHACSRGVPLGEIHFETFKRLVQSYPNFLADASALTLVGRCPMLLKLRGKTELLERLSFATDYPLPPSAAVLFGRTSMHTFLDAQREKNPFDKNVKVFRALGLEPTSEPLERRLALG